MSDPEPSTSAEGGPPRPPRNVVFGLDGEDDDPSNPREVQVIDSQKKDLGIMPLMRALKLARSRGSDLVGIDASVSPPLYQIIDYGRFRYELQKERKRGAA